jgi:hypothetical protein
MFSFKNFITEANDKSLSNKEKKNNKKIKWYDMDETLLHHDNSKVRVHVHDNSGNRIRSLTNQEFNTHKLPKDHKYDFSEFESSEIFGKSANPIHKMIRNLKGAQEQGHKVEILTARSDLDDQKAFAHHMSKFGIDIDKVHVRRAGNTKKDPAEAKKQIAHELIKKHNYGEAHLYDDSKSNLDAFLSLKKKHPEVDFYAHHVNHNHKTGETKVTTRKV